MTVGKAPHVILGQEMLKPGDGPEKDEGELPGGKRLIGRLRQRHGHFADVIVADALYLNAPFINTIKENGLEAVIRLKDKKRLIFQDAEGLFNRGEGKKKTFQHEKKTVEVWDLYELKIENCPHRLRVVRYHESWKDGEKEAERWMWLVTTLGTKHRGTLCALGSREQATADEMPGKWICYKNAWIQKLKAKSLLSNERLSSAFSLRSVVKLTVNKCLTNTNIRHINSDMTDTYKFILDISLVYLTRG